ncbi:glycosyl transferase [Thermoanaerobacterium thermosaccharolyticum]|uniref:Glycosyl transferase n=2 Tax=Thermoanaerobacterium thermosaccharolyticum TaxID=1517 RepID=A0A231VET3_THETR|nr:glycosyltransferase [Thermoanaerobacterium thermosaccharolyticum]OXT06690.1 glycosyl transferase [Thermoanaerobacterium thermosaccharolyticum]
MQSEVKPGKYRKNKKYIPVIYKFYISQFSAILWVILSIKLSQPWLHELSKAVGFPLALFIITFIAYAPGYLVAFDTVSLLLDKQPSYRNTNPDIPITVLIAARNEADKIADTLKYISTQEYNGKIQVVIVDNNSSDGTIEAAKNDAKHYGIQCKFLFESKPGKNNALNTGLKTIDTEYFITLDADTLLHRNAINNIVSRILSAPPDVCAVAGHVLVRNSRNNILSKMQEWDYFMGIASLKRMQGLYQDTLVAQGAFSLYKTDIVKKIGGWEDVIGEDIVLTWKFFKSGYKVYFEPFAVAFTEVPTRMKHFIRQRSRWARGMFEGFKKAGPLQQERFLARFLISLDILIPFIDMTYTFVWIPGLIIAFWGKYYIVGPYTLLVLPLNIFVTIVMYIFQKNVFDSLGLKIRRNRLGYIFYILFYQVIHSPIAVWGYMQEILNLRKTWK